MLKFTWLRMKRQSMPGILVALLGAVVAVVLCSLQLRGQQARENCRQVCESIRVRCTVTNLSGDRTDGLSIGNDELALFAPELLFYREAWLVQPQPDESIAALVEDVQAKACIPVIIQGEAYTLAGITSLDADGALSPENGNVITWRGDNSEEIFAKDSLLCLAPESLLKKLAATDDIPEKDADPGLTTHIPLLVEGEEAYQAEDFTADLPVAGSYVGREGNTIYLSMEAYAKILQQTGRAITAQSLSAILRDNDDLEALRQTASQWFAQPGPENAGLSWVDGCYLGLDIADSRLQEAEKALENSLRVLAVASAAILVLSAGVGFLMGFLMVHRRRREIALLRTVGTPNRAIFLSFGLEQMLCFAVGIGLGGAYNQWQPGQQLVLLVAIFAIGLIAALLIFLNKNLMTSIKEDE